MKVAHRIYREGKYSWSKSLKKAWEWGKKKLVDVFYSVTSDIIERETEKAVLVIMDYKYSHTLEEEVPIKAWFPKSMIKDGFVPKWFWVEKYFENKRF